MLVFAPSTVLKCSVLMAGGVRRRAFAGDAVGFHQTPLLGVVARSSARRNASAA
jgi:hypothetical protein